jgi:hypothetical protein
MGIGISHVVFVCSFLDAYEKLVGVNFGIKKKKRKKKRSVNGSRSFLE